MEEEEEEEEMLTSEDEEDDWSSEKRKKKKKKKKMKESQQFLDEEADVDSENELSQESNSKVNNWNKSRLKFKIHFFICS